MQQVGSKPSATLRARCGPLLPTLVPALVLVLGLLAGPGGAAAAVNGVERIERLQQTPAPAAEALPGLPGSAFVPLADTRRLVDGRATQSWWRLTPAAGPGERLLLVYHPYSARVTVLAPPDYRAQTRTVFDRELDPRFSRRALVFPLAAAGPVFIGVAQARYPLRVAVTDADAYAAADLAHVRLLALVIGVLVGIAVVGLLFWLLLRERVYLLYSATMALQLLYLLCAHGEAYALPGLRALARFGAPGIWFIATLSTATGVFLLIDLAGLRLRAPGYTRWLRWIGGYAPLLLLGGLLLLAWRPWPAGLRWFPVVGNLLLLGANLLALLALCMAWQRGSRRAGYALIAWAPLVALTTLRAVQLGTGAPLTPLVEYGLPLGLAFAAVLLTLVLADRMLSFRRERDRAQEFAERDPLTGVLNRAGIEQRLQWALGRGPRDRRALSVLFLDLDYFKQVNDSHGHGFGDACLRSLVAVVGRELRYGDKLGRLGGEEFLLMLPGLDGERAAAVAERIRAAVAQQCIEVDDVPVALTVSIGVAEHQPMDTVATMITRADRAMYAAKHAGRNRVVRLDELPA